MNIAASPYMQVKPSWIQPVQGNRVCSETLKGVLVNARFSTGVMFFGFFKCYTRNLTIIQDRVSQEDTLKHFSMFVSAVCQVDLLHGL